MKFINKKIWKQLFETALQKQQWLVPFVEDHITLVKRKLVKSKSSLLHKPSKDRLKFIIVIV